MTTLVQERPATLPSALDFVHTLERQTFRYTLDICLKDSNAYGNTYFARYFEWQGVCRERWFYECIANSMLKDEGVFITKDAHQQYIQETFPFQTVACEVNTFDIRQCSFSLEFRFYVAGKLVSKGWQNIVFARHDKRIARLPEHILDRVRMYEKQS